MHTIKHGGLIAVILENVKGVLQSIGGAPSFMKRLLMILQKEVPAIHRGGGYRVPDAYKSFPIAHLLSHRPPIPQIDTTN